MADLLVRYLAELNGNPDKMAQHDANSQMAAEAAGLCDADVNLIVSGMHSEIKARCAAQTRNSMVLVTLHSPN